MKNENLIDEDIQQTKENEANSRKLSDLAESARNGVNINNSSFS